MAEKVLKVFTGLCTLIGLTFVLGLAVWKGIEIAPTVIQAFTPKVQVEPPPVATTPTSNTKSK